MFYQFNHLGSPDYLKIEKNQDFSFPLHLHQCFELIIILSGEMEIAVDNKNYLVKEREALLIFPNQIHSLSSTKSRHVLCIFSPDLVQAYATKVTNKLPADSKFLPDTYLINALENMDENTSTIEKKGLLYSFCGQFDKAAAYESKRGDNAKLLYKIFSFVEEEFSNDCSLSELAKVIGYDYSYLSRFFKRTVGISFNSYVNHYRLSHACYLMNNTDFPILRCALDSGYTSLRSFNRNFKEYFGVTPMEYRKNKEK